MPDDYEHRRRLHAAMTRGQRLDALTWLQAQPEPGPQHWQWGYDVVAAALERWREAQDPPC